MRREQPNATQQRSLPGSMRSGKSIARKRSARRVTAWADRSWSRPQRPCRTASARALRSTAEADSPHLLAPKIKARMYFGIAANDDMQQPDAKTKLKEAFAAAKVPAEIEVYSTSQHGWCVSDMPKQANGEPIYNKSDAERAWGKLLALYKAGLV